MLIIVLSMVAEAYGAVKGRVSGRTEKSCSSIDILTSFSLRYAL
jgi:hypothetical protein